MDLIESTSFEKAEPANSSLSGLFFFASRLLGKDKLINFVNILSEDDVPPAKGVITNLIDANIETNYESGIDNSSIIFYFPHQKIKLTYYNFTSQSENQGFTPFLNWSLYGSYDNINWTTLDCQKNEINLRKPSTSSIYKINNQEYFKIIKILSPDKIALSAVEFFGYAQNDNKAINISVKEDLIPTFHNQSNEKLSQDKTSQSQTTNSKKTSNDLNNQSTLQIFKSNEQNNIDWNDEVIEIPKLSPNLESTMSMSFQTPYEPVFYQGLFNIIKSKFYCSALKCGFVQIFADTKKRESIKEESLVDCNKETNWFSTNKKRPSITLFFPFHILSINSIGFRSHTDHRFGMHFISNFIIEGLDQNQDWVLLGAYKVKKFIGYEVKGIVDCKNINVRAIRIRNEGKFGLSYIELYGKASSSPMKDIYTKKMLTNTSISLMKDPKIFENAFVSNVEGKKSTTHKIVAIFKNAVSHNPNKTENVPKWTDDSDFVESDPDLKDLSFEAYDPNGPSLIETFEKMTASNVKLFSPNISLLSKKFNYEPSSKKCIRIDFKELNLHLTGLKIKTCNYEQYLPFGFIIGGISEKNRNKEQFELITSTPKEKLLQNTEYFIPINNSNFFSSLVIISYCQSFHINSVEFYGNEKVDDERVLDKKIMGFYDNNQESTSIPLFICDPILITNSFDPSGPSIFQQMIQFYGPLLNGFMRMFLMNKTSIKVYYNEGIDLKITSTKHPAIFFLFHQHFINVKYIKIKATQNGNCLSDFLVVSKEAILAELSHNFDAGEEFIFQIDNKTFSRFIYIYSLNGPFEIDEIEFYGKLKEGELIDKHNDDDETFEFDSKVIQKYLSDKKTERDNDQYENEKNKSYESNPNILFSAEKGRNDICSIGAKRDHNFYEFWCCGKSGTSILMHDEDNLWLTTDDNGINSFIINFPNHSVRLKRFVICTPKDPKYREFMPDSFFIYGYSSRSKRWDILYIRDSENLLDFMGSYSFEIKNDTKNNFYRSISFVSLTGRVAFAYLSLYGDVKEERSKIDNRILQTSIPKINFDHMPTIIACHDDSSKYQPGLFMSAIPIFGPELKNFVAVKCKSDEYSKYYDIWNIRNKCYTSVERNDLIIISFYFPNHDIFLEGYQIRPDRFPNLDCWAIVGYKSPDSKGVILSHVRNKKMTSYNSYYPHGIECNQPFRIILFVGLNEQFSFKLLDFFGVAKPGKKDPFDNYNIPGLPRKVRCWYEGDD